MPRIAIIEDHEIAMKGLEQMLSEDPDIEIVAKAYSGRQGVEAVGRYDPDVVIVDLELPDADFDGIDVVRFLADNAKHSALLVVTGKINEYGVQRLVEAGALGYVTKEARTDELLKAVAAVSKGDPYMSIAAQRMFRYEVRAPSGGLPLLSSREYEVARLVAQSKSNKDIATALGISVHTVAGHVSEILTKWNAHSRVEVAILALRHGIATPESAGSS